MHFKQNMLIPKEDNNLSKSFMLYEKEKFRFKKHNIEKDYKDLINEN